MIWTGCPVYPLACMWVHPCSLHRKLTHPVKMEIKKIAFAALMVAASATAVVATEAAAASDANTVAAAPTAALAAVSFLAYFLY